MMATTHGFVGLAMASAVAVVAPEYALPAAVGGIVGGVFPDLDLLGAHRKTLHFPVYYWVLALPACGVALVAPGAWSVGAALLFLAAAVHSGSDAWGGGLELRPWEGTADRAVYDHARKRWVAPRRGVRYDGAPEDLALAALFAVPCLLVFDGRVRTLAVAGLLLSVGYALVRKRIVDYAPEWLR